MVVQAAGFFIDLGQSFAGILGSGCHFVPNCDIILIGFKIVMLLFIVGWVRGHLGGGIIATLVMLFMGYFMLFDFFFIFGPLAAIYILAIVGVTGLAMDLVFTKHYYLPGGSHGGGEMAAAGPAHNMMEGGEHRK